MVKVKRLYEDARVPAFQTAQAKARDLHAYVHDRVVTFYNTGNDKYLKCIEGDEEGRRIALLPLHRALIPTGIAIALPGDCEALISLRSSAVKKGLVMVNSPGIIDSDYRGELFVPVANISNKTVVIEHGERFAQVRTRRVLLEPAWIEGELDKTERGKGGFGSTGQ